MDYEQPAAVYRLYDADGALLYIGMTRNEVSRWKSHRKEMLWWREVVSKHLTWHDTRWQAWEADRHAIRTEGPAHRQSRRRLG
ncbi:GIY-YIG nuclease family protein [Streptomyces sp. 058-1L]|uniref:GIY-YIG nuclease family protein n=1 Tax=Streptomyces sp. 058-1L TaxID=2789266 RepID=UPI0039818502